MNTEAGGGKTGRGWIWFGLLMVLILAVGVVLNMNRRRDLGESFVYSLDEYRQVDPALVHFEESDRLRPELGTLKAVALGPEDQVVVGGESGIAVLHSSGKEQSRFELELAPECLAVDDDGTVFVGFRDHIELFSLKGERMAVWSSLGERAYLTCIAVTDKEVYAADAGNRTVWRLDRDGKTLGQIKGRVDDPSIKGFFVPSPYFDVALGNDDSLWVVNPGFHALENYREDGTLISAWNKTSMHVDGFSGCCNPVHIAMLPDGSFVTSEKGIPRVKIHGVTGELVSVVAGPDQFDELADELDLAVDSQGRIFVLDPSEAALRIFTRKKT